MKVRNLLPVSPQLAPETTDNSKEDLGELKSRVMDALFTLLSDQATALRLDLGVLDKFLRDIRASHTPSSSSPSAVKASLAPLTELLHLVNAVEARLSNALKKYGSTEYASVEEDLVRCEALLFSIKTCQQQLNACRAKSASGALVAEIEGATLPEAGITASSSSSSLSSSSSPSSSSSSSSPLHGDYDAVTLHTIVSHLKKLLLLATELRKRRNVSVSHSFTPSTESTSSSLSSSSSSSSSLSSSSLPLKPLEVVSMLERISMIEQPDSLLPKATLEERLLQRDKERKGVENMIVESKATEQEIKSKITELNATKEATKAMITSIYRDIDALEEEVEKRNAEKVSQTTYIQRLLVKACQASKNVAKLGDYLRNQEVKIPEGLDDAGGPGGKLFAKTLQTIDFNSRVTLPSVHSTEFRGFGVSPCGLYIAAASWDMRVGVYSCADRKKQELDSESVCHISHIWGLRWHPTELKFATIGMDKRIIVWSRVLKNVPRSSSSSDGLNNSGTSDSSDGSGSDSDSIESSGIGDTDATSNGPSNDGDSSTVEAAQQQHEQKAKEEVWRGKVLVNLPFAGSSVAWSLDGKHMVVVGYGRSAVVLNAEDGSTISKLGGLVGDVWDCNYHPTEAIFSTNGDDKLIRIWDSNNFTCLHTLRGHLHPIWTFEFSPDGKYAASGDEAGKVHIWDTAHWTELHAVSTKVKGEAWGLSWHPNSKIVAVGAKGGTHVHILNAKTGEILQQQDLRSLRQFTTPRWSPDGHFLYVGNGGELLRFNAPYYI